MECIGQQLLNEDNSNGLTYKTLGLMTPVGMTFGEIVTPSVPHVFQLHFPETHRLHGTRERTIFPSHFPLATQLIARSNRQAAIGCFGTETEI